MREDTGQSFADRVSQYRERIDGELSRWLNKSTAADSVLLDAMRYSLLGGGKRIRPLLAYASGELLQLEPQQIDPIAAAVEMIHAYSLVHDDLPSMDDDDIRRGRPTVHVQFDEATAVLVGDALQALAFQVLTDTAIDAQTSAALVRHLSHAIGPAGMVSGQVMDIAFSGTDVSRDELEEMFVRKTGLLIGAAILMPMCCSKTVNRHTESSLYRFAELAGLCFQIHDDILDETGSTEKIGKPNGSDARNERASYPARFGLDVARSRAAEIYRQASDCLADLGPRAEGLRWLARYFVDRDY